MDWLRFLFTIAMMALAAWAEWQRQRMETSFHQLAEHQRTVEAKRLKALWQRDDAVCEVVRLNHRVSELEAQRSRLLAKLDAVAPEDVTQPNHEACEAARRACEAAEAKGGA